MFVCGAFKLGGVAMINYEGVNLGFDIRHTGAQLYLNDLMLWSETLAY